MQQRFDSERQVWMVNSIQQIEVETKSGFLFSSSETVSGIMFESSNYNFAIRDNLVEVELLYGNFPYEQNQEDFASVSFNPGRVPEHRRIRRSLGLHLRVLNGSAP